jgi:HEAT repeat protein
MTLDKIGAPIAVGTMRRALADGDQATQMWAIRGLGQLKDGESVALLIDRMCHDPNHRVRRAAAMALAKLGDPRALDPMRRAHDEATGFTRRRMGRALRELESRIA